MEESLAIVKTFILLGVVIYLISLSLKFLNRYTNRVTRGISILQKVSVTKSSSIGVIKIAETYYVMSFSETQNQILKELTVDEAKLFLQNLQAETTETEVSRDFANLLKETSERMFKKRPKK
ncbi:flagellar biosynthetic protein FliO [Enterococcus italicus]|uniref:flagellar biosynthetic protein FliO n=1 Tax=Enterococcus italicus TaxID=246144 RepID=UPI0028ACAC60|nr:flagellar biosynthetic protein FliO [Enterococcus italicus]